MARIGQKEIQPIGCDRPAHIFLIEDLQIYLKPGLAGEIICQGLVTFLKDMVRSIGENAKGQRLARTDSLDRNQLADQEQDEAND